MIRTLVALALLAAAPGFAHESPEALQEAFMAALRAGDADGIADCYAEDADNFTLDTLKGVGPESARTSWGGFFEQFDVISAELTEDRMVREDDLAAAWGLFVVVARPVGGGEPVTFKGRYMDVARPIDGRWLYIADHASMPLPASEE